MDDEISFGENNHSPWIIVFLIGALIWALFFHEPRYEGQTAEEWFNEYDWVAGCVESIANERGSALEAYENCF